MARSAPGVMCPCVAAYALASSRAAALMLAEKTRKGSAAAATTASGGDMLTMIAAAHATWGVNVGAGAVNSGAGT
eukprot:8730380-Pyramimonas_sp.AAC.1